MGAILGREWGGAFVGGQKVFDINGEWKQLALPDTDALKSVQIIYQISGANLNLVGMGITKEISTTPVDNWLSLSFLDFSPLVKSFKKNTWVIAANMGGGDLAMAYMNNSGYGDSHTFGGITNNSGIITLGRTATNAVSQSLVGDNYVLFGGYNGFVNLSVNKFK